MYTDIPGFNLVLYIFFFLIGLTFGSFANVCIYRIPLDLSIIRPRSSCTKCKKQVAWHDNIPLLSYIMLGGKCRYCEEKISLIYPLVELITGLSFIVLFYFYGLTVPLFLFCFLSFCLIVISGIDFYYQIIPDIFPLMLAVAGLLFSIFNETLGVSYLQRFLNALIGLVVGGGFLLLIGIVGQFMFKKEAMGGGDVKLMAGVGAIIGWEKVLLAIFIASFLGSIVGLFLILFKKVERRGYLPFGPFLAAASYITLLLPAPSILMNAFFAWEMNLIHKIFGA
ncbi:MAG: prepilin peptidase [Endomicrobia bacterium]|jgi:leader peptidase (prepilin peptidase)/N-methyltransferase|nr:prepilin peptidase [Endomicrobiia bacterium]